MEYISNNVILKNHEYKEHYLGWCLTGSYYINDEKILSNSIYDIANICCLSAPKKNMLDVVDDSVVFSGTDELRIIGKDDNSGIKFEDCFLVIFDYGLSAVNIEEKILEAMNGDFVNEALKKEKKDIEHIYCGRPEIIYKQSIINKGIKFINSKNTEKIMIGDLKVKLKELEN